MTNIKPSKDSQWIYVESSSIHNKGVFAFKEIPKNTTIIEYTGVKVKQSKAADREARDEKNGTIYLFELDKKHYIDGADGGSDAIYINHSCAPNCEVINDGKQLWIKSIKKIAQGQELSFDYCFDWDVAEDHPCRCGHANCRGYIVNSNQYKRLKKYLRYNKK